MHIGDQVFGLAMTDLIQGCFPRLRVGPTSVRLIGLLLTLALVPECNPLENEGPPETYRAACESVRYSLQVDLATIILMPPFQGRIVPSA